MYRTSRDNIQNIAVKARKLPVIGTISTVNTSTDPDDVEPVRANVILRDGKKQLRGVPVLISHHEGHMAFPRRGDTVKVDYIDGEINKPAIVEFVQTVNRLPPLGRRGHWRHEFRREGADPLYLEAEPSDHSDGDPDVVRMAIKENGIAEPSTEVAIDDSGDVTSVSVSTDGSVDIDAGQGVTIDAAGGFKVSDVSDLDGNKMLDSVVDTGSVSLSGGVAEVGTNISDVDTTFMLALGVDDPDSDAEVSGSLYWDDSANQYEVRIRESSTSVDPTVNYDIIRVR